MHNPEAVFDEDLLVQRAIDGDADAFGELYLHYLDAIYRYVYFRVGGPQDAEDLTEQIFLKAWEALPGYKYVGFPFSSWLYRIAHNIVVDHHRSKRPVEAFQHEFQEDWHTRETSMIDQVMASEDQVALAGAISHLTDEQQQVIVLRFIEGMDHAQVGRIMNKSEGACRMLQNRALTALNQLLDQTRILQDA